MIKMALDLSDLPANVNIGSAGWELETRRDREKNKQTKKKTAPQVTMFFLLFSSAMIADFD